MPAIRELTVYKFEELSDSAKERARDWWRSCESQEFDTEFMYDDFKAIADILGIEFNQRAVPLMNGSKRYEPTIWWSGFSSQGDGACFEGRYRYAKGAPKAIAEYAPKDSRLLEIAQGLQAIQSRHFYRLESIVKHRGHYYHEYCTEIDVFDREDNYRDIGDAAESIAELMRDFMRWIYRQLEAEHEYRMSDENVDESIIANEYEFTEEGAIA